MSDSEIENNLDFNNDQFQELTPERLKELYEISKKLPKSPSSDWDGTNHYEFNGYVEERDFWTWWELGDKIPEGDISSTIWGKRLGYIMDAASALPDAMEQIKQLTLKANAFQNSFKYYQRHIRSIENLLGKTKAEIKGNSLKIIGPSLRVQRMVDYNKTLESIVLKLNTNKEHELNNSEKDIIFNILRGEKNDA